MVLATKSCGWLAGLGLAALLPLWACASTDEGGGVTETDAAADVTTDVERDGGVDVEVGSPSVPAGIAFRDADPRKSSVQGTIRVTHAADETQLDEYRLYWVDVDGTRLGPAITALPKGAAVLEYTLPAETHPPPGTTKLAAVGARGSLESSLVSTKADNFPLHFDVGGESGVDTVTHSRALVDTFTGKLLVVASNASAKPTLRRCNLDGTQCAALSLDAGRPQGSGSLPSAVIDAVGKKLLVVAEDRAATESTGPTDKPKPSLYRCDLDGTHCTWVDISAGQPVGSGFAPIALVEPGDQRLLVVTMAESPAGTRPLLFRCGLDGRGCTSTDLSAEAGSIPAYTPVDAVVDAAAGKLLVVAQSPAQNGRLWLYRCNLDGTACTLSEINPGVSPTIRGGAAAIDAVGGKLLVVTEDRAAISAGVTSLTRCNLDGTACVHSVLLGALPLSGASPAALVVGDELIVGTRGPSLLRCTLTGSRCQRIDLSPGSFYEEPSLAVDAAGARLLVAVAASDAGASGPPTLFRHALDGSAIERKDLSAGPGAAVPLPPAAALDAVGGKLLTVFLAGSSSVLSRCDLGGTGCSAAPLTFGGQTRTAVVDAQNGKLLLVGLARCDLDGTDCTTPFPGDPRDTPSAVIDTKNRKIIIASVARSGGFATTTRCELDGTGCVPIDVTLGRGPGSGLSASIAIDLANDRLLVATVDFTFGNRPRVVRCKLDGTECSLHDVSAGDTAPLQVLRLLADARFLYVVGLRQDGGHTLYRCGLDATACTRADLVLGGTGLAGALIDGASEKLLIVSDDARSRGPQLDRCELDGSGCLHVDMSAEQGPSSALGPTALLDSSSHRLLVVAENPSNLFRPSLFALDLW